MIINPLAERPNRDNGRHVGRPAGDPSECIMRATLELYRLAELAAVQGPAAQRCRHLMDNAMAVATLNVRQDRSYSDSLDKAALDLLNRVEQIVRDADFREAVGRAFADPLYNSLCRARVAIYERISRAGEPEPAVLPWREAA